MKRTITVLFALALLGLALPAGATDTRIRSMGGGFKYLTVMDEANVLVFPQVLVDWTNTMYVEGGSVWGGARTDTTATNAPYNVALGMHYGLGENTVVGVYGSSMSRYVGGEAMDWALGRWVKTQGMAATEKTGDDAIHNADHKGSLLFAHRMAALRLGLLLEFWGDSYNRSLPETTQKEIGGSWFGAIGGLGVDFGRKNKIDLALGFHYGSFTDDMSATGSTDMVTRLKASPAWNFSLNGRGVFEAFGGNAVVPYLTLEYGQNGVEWYEEVDDAPVADGKHLTVAAGADLVIEPLDGLFIQPGVGMAYGMVVVEGDEKVQDDSSLVLPYYNLGVDAKLAKWFDLRFGVAQYLTSSQAAGVGTEEKGSDVITSFQTGFGLKFQSVEMDFLLNPAFLTNGPYVLSGAQTAGGMAFQFGLKTVW